MISLSPTPETRQQIGEFLTLIDQLAAPPEDAIRPIQEAIRAGFAANFDNEAAGEAPWGELTNFTQRERRRLGFPPAHPILERTGRYRRSFTEEAALNHVSEYTTAGGRWVIAEGSQDERAEELEYGRFDMPGRPVTVLGPTGEQRIGIVLDLMFAEWIE